MSGFQAPDHPERKQMPLFQCLQGDSELMSFFDTSCARIPTVVNGKQLRLHVLRSQYNVYGTAEAKSECIIRDQREFRREYGEISPHEKSWRRWYDQLEKHERKYVLLGELRGLMYVNHVQDILTWRIFGQKRHPLLDKPRVADNVCIFRVHLYVLSLVWVIMYGVWIGEWIYWNTEPPLISTIHKVTTAPAKPFPACCFFNNLSQQRILTVEILQLHAFESSLHRLPYRTKLAGSESESELLYDWRFTANQSILAPSTLRPTTNDF
jgi:hypothetical protein